MNQTATPSDSKEKNAVSSGKRLASIDALRGFDMFWIIGGNGLVITLMLMFSDPLPTWLSGQLAHVEWEGFTAWDLIMPLFLFIVGVAMPFSFGKKIEQGSRKSRIYFKVLRRTILLFLLGMVAQGRLLAFDLSELHIYCNTLQAIACGYLVASIALLELPVKWQGILTVALLMAYWLLMAFVPFQGHAAGTSEPTANLALFIDDAILGRFSDGSPYTWILSSLTFGATVLLGVFGGHLLRSGKSDRAKCLWLVGIGVGCLIAGALWNVGFPINKHLWSSSMVLWAGGWSYLLLALFFWVIDVLGYKKWAFPFKVIGMNAIAVYMATMLVRFSKITDPIVGGLTQHLGGFGEFLEGLAAFMVIWLILLYMYRKKTFLRI